MRIARTAFSCLILFVAGEACAQVRLFMAEPGAERFTPRRGATAVVVEPGERATINVWLEDSDGEQTLRVCQVCLPWFGTPLSNASGNVHYSDYAAYGCRSEAQEACRPNDPNACDGNPNDCDLTETSSLTVDTGRPDFLFARSGDITLTAHEHRPPLEAYHGFGATFSLPARRPRKRVDGLRYLFQFEIEASLDARGTHEFAFVSPGEPPIGGTWLGQPTAADYTIDLYQPLRVIVAEKPRSVPPTHDTQDCTHIFDGYIDPCIESTSGKRLDGGLSRLTVAFNVPIENTDGSELSAKSFRIADTADLAPFIDSVTSPDDRLITVHLSGPITVGAWTTLVVSARTRESHIPVAMNVSVGFLPGDVNQDGLVSAEDMTLLRKYLDGSTAPRVGSLEHFADVNCDGVANPFDLIAQRRILDGIAPATRAWQGSKLP